MPSTELIFHGAHVMTVCNACRYCEHFCPVFPAMEQRLVFRESDLAYLANLCHNCGECLYSCQYAPPHEFGIDVPRTLARLRHRSYERYAWPGWLGSAFRRQGMATASLLASAMCAGLFAAVSIANPGALWRPGIDGDFYSVMPHLAMVSLFGIVGLAVAAALAVGSVRCWRDMEGARAPLTPKALRRAFGDAFSLRHLHGAGDDCVSAEERRTPWRRWCHHCTFYGFGLCTASTTVAAAYHASGVVAPYAYGSLPVVLGTLGGAGLLVGPVGLWVLGQRRDPALMDPERPGLDDALLVLLFATSLTGLLLLIFREHAAMGLLLVVHLGVVLALFLSLPYGKFVHGLYRLLALLKYARESEERGGADS